MANPSSSCMLCAQGGGSLASTNVLGHVSCGAFDRISSTNQVAGAGATNFSYSLKNSHDGGGSTSSKKRKAAAMRPRTKKHTRGGASCDSCTSAPATTNVFQNYTLGTSTVPLTFPLASSSQPPSTTPQQVLRVLAAEPATLDRMFTDVVYPNYIPTNNIPATYNGLFQ